MKFSVVVTHENGEELIEFDTDTTSLNDAIELAGGEIEGQEGPGFKGPVIIRIKPR